MGKSFQQEYRSRQRRYANDIRAEEREEQRLRALTPGTGGHRIVDAELVRTLRIAEAKRDGERIRAMTAQVKPVATGDRSTRYVRECTLRLQDGGNYQSKAARSRVDYVSPSRALGIEPDRRKIPDPTPERLAASTEFRAAIAEGRAIAGLREFRNPGANDPLHKSRQREDDARAETRRRLDAIKLDK